jgi:hypothetical protein
MPPVTSKKHTVPRLQMPFPDWCYYTLCIISIFLGKTYHVLFKFTEKCICRLIYYHIIEHYHKLIRNRNRISIHALMPVNYHWLFPLQTQWNKYTFHSPLTDNLTRLTVIIQAVFIASSKI